MENPIKMDDLGVPLFLETAICSKLKGLHVMGCSAINIPSTIERDLTKRPLSKLLELLDTQV